MRAGCYKVYGVALQGPQSFSPSKNTLQSIQGILLYFFIIMITKSSLPILAVSLMASYSAAADLQEVSFTAWSGKDCGADDSKAFTEASHRLSTWNTTAETIHCAATLIDWRSWPQENGKYVTYIESGFIEEKCQLIFYKGLPNDDNGEGDRCFTPYRTLDGTSGCATVSIPPKFGVV
jgi:hypothetical protein